MAKYFCYVQFIGQITHSGLCTFIAILLNMSKNFLVHLICYEKKRANLIKLFFCGKSEWCQGEKQGSMRILIYSYTFKYVYTLQ